jgi:hypothetical protein
MPKYIVEREIPRAGALTPEELKEISQRSCKVLDQLGTGIQWVESFVTEDKIYCVYIAPNKDIILEHSKQGGFPADRIEEVRNLISPLSAV